MLDKTKVVSKTVGTSHVSRIDGFRDRVSVLFSRKIQLKDYEPVELQFWYASDVKNDETVQKTFQRVIKVVTEISKEEIHKTLELKKKLRKG